MVEEVGAAVTRVTPGDHVVLTWMPPCRACFWCLAGQPMLCEQGWPSPSAAPTPAWAGRRLVRGLGTATFAEQTLVPEGEVIADRPGGATGPGSPGGLRALHRVSARCGTRPGWLRARRWPSSAAAAWACLCIQGARLAGASTDRGRRPGCVEAGDGEGPGGDGRRRRLRHGDPVEAVRRPHRRPGGRTTASRWSGRAGAIRQAFAMTRRGGTAVLVGAGIAGRRRCRSRHGAVRRRQDAGRLRLRIDRPRPRLPRPGGPRAHRRHRRRAHGDPAGSPSTT